MSNQWVRYVCKDTGDPFWYNNVSREQRWDPPPPPRPTANESTLVSSDSVPGDDEAGKSALKGKAKLDSLAKTSKRKTQDKLVQPPTKKRDVLSDGRVAASETAEIVPPPSRLTAIEASFDPFDQTLNLKDKHVKDKESNMVLVKGLKTKMEELELKIVRPEQPGRKLPFGELREYCREQFGEWHDREGTQWTDSNFIMGVERSALSRERKPHSAYAKRAMEKAAKAEAADEEEEKEKEEEDEEEEDNSAQKKRKRKGKKDFHGIMICFC